jgi:hypothetical protein
MSHEFEMEAGHIRHHILVASFDFVLTVTVAFYAIVKIL